MSTTKRLYKSSEGAVFGGVCKGISEVYQIDVSVVRILTVLLLFVVGAPLILYLIFWLVLPDKKDVVTYNDPKDDYTVEGDDDYYY